MLREFVVFGVLSLVFAVLVALAFPDTAIKLGLLVMLFFGFLPHGF